MWLFRRNRARVRKDPRPKLHDVYVAQKLIRTHTAAIHGQLSTLLTYVHALEAHVADLTKQVRRLEQRDRPVPVALHLVPDKQGRGPNHVDYNLEDSDGTA